MKKPLIFATNFDKRLVGTGIVPMFEVGAATADEQIAKCREYFQPLAPDRRAIHFTNPYAAAPEMLRLFFMGISTAMPAMIYIDDVGSGPQPDQPSGLAFGENLEQRYYNIRAHDDKLLRERIALPFLSVYGKLCPMIRWRSCWPKFPIFDDSHGWQKVGHGILADWSSPDIYTGWAGGRAMQGRDHGDPLNHYNQLIDCQNHVRACLPNVIPVLSGSSFYRDGKGESNNAPKYARWLWMRNCRHLAASGVRTWLWWNPLNITDQAVADMVEASQMEVTSPMRPLPAIELGAKEVRTGRYTTELSKYLAMAGVKYEH